MLCSGFSLFDDGGETLSEKRVDKSCEVAFKATSCIRESLDDDDDASASISSPSKNPELSLVILDDTSNTISKPVPVY